uniref:Phospholipase A2 group III n=1 Tax=Xiphophorus couchianus TaxID=32473 RepID=A0A3B5MIG0_9TELE
MTHIFALLALTVTSTLLGCTAARASIHCSWTKVSSNGQLHVSFLRGDPHGSAAAPRLYHGVWSGERALLGCTWSDDAALIQSYLSACRGRTREFKDRAGRTLDLESLFDADRCVSLASPSERSEVRTHARVKRGFIVPGTLWCGSGNKQNSFPTLSPLAGVFSDTDSCCREHDQCKHTILSFQSDFGVFNSNIFTMSHCDCDNKFRSCLMEANDSIADVVGYTFFNLLKMHSPAPTSTPPHLHDSTKQTRHVCTCRPPPLPRTRCPQPGPLPPSPQRPTLRTPQTPRRQHRLTTPLQVLQPEGAIGLVLHSVTETEIPPDVCIPSTAEDKSCVPYKELDECKNKILPQQRKYGLHNTETGTLFHCNCTANCTATVVKAELPRLDPTSVEVAERRHLQAERRKRRRPGETKAKRKDRAARLYKLCVRMTRPKQTGKNKKQVTGTQVN